MRLLIGCLCLWSALALAADDTQRPKATTFSADVSGMWFNPSESGWGVNIIQQSDIMFVTLFVYDSNGRPLWLVGSDVRYTGQDGAGAYLFSGALYQTSGPWFGSSIFNPSAVSAPQVGTVSFRFPTYDQGRITYSVNGITVSKQIQPLTFRLNNLNGSYLGSVYGAVASCNLPLPQIAAGVVGIDVVHTASNVTITLVDASFARCILSGRPQQFGKLVDIDGTYTCTTGSSGEFAIRRLEAGIDGLSGAFYRVSSGINCGATIATIGAARVQ